jgi:hypothetical protein
LEWRDSDGAKLYTISVNEASVDQTPFMCRMDFVKSIRPVPWSQIPHFAIFHEGSAYRYLILCWWGNDNELFTSVSVLTDEGWVERPDRYSFCVYDLEVVWDERNAFIDTMDCKEPSLQCYQQRRRQEWLCMIQNK